MLEALLLTALSDWIIGKGADQAVDDVRHRTEQVRVLRKVVRAAVIRATAAFDGRLSRAERRRLRRLPLNRAASSQALDGAKELPSLRDLVTRVISASPMAEWLATRHVDPAQFGDVLAAQVWNGIERDARRGGSLKPLADSLQMRHLIGLNDEQLRLLGQLSANIGQQTGAIDEILLRVRSIDEHRRLAVAGRREAKSAFYGRYLPYPIGIPRDHGPIGQELSADRMTSGRALILVGAAGVGKTEEARRLLFQAASATVSDPAVWTVRTLDAVSGVVGVLMDEPSGARLLLVDDLVGSFVGEVLPTYRTGVEYVRALLIDGVTVVATSRDYVWNANATSIEHDLFDIVELTVPPDLDESWKTQLLQRWAEKRSCAPLDDIELSAARHLQTPKDIVAFTGPPIQRLRTNKITFLQATDEAREVVKSISAEVERMLRAGGELEQAAGLLALLVLALDGLDLSSLADVAGHAGLLRHVSFEKVISRVLFVADPDLHDYQGVMKLWHDDVYMGVWKAAVSDPERGVGALGALLAQPEAGGYLDVNSSNRLFRVAGVWAQDQVATHLASSQAQLMDWIRVWERHENLLVVAGQMVVTGDSADKLIAQFKIAYEALAHHPDGILAAKLYGHSVLMHEDWPAARAILADAWVQLIGTGEPRLSQEIFDDTKALRLATFIATHIGLCWSKEGESASALDWYSIALEAGEKRLRLLRGHLDAAASSQWSAVRSDLSDAEFLLHEAENHKANTLQGELEDYRGAAEIYVAALGRLRRLQQQDPTWRELDVIMQETNVTALLAMALAHQPEEVISQALAALPTDLARASTDEDLDGPAVIDADAVLALVRRGTKAFSRWEALHGRDEPASHPRRANLARAQAERLIKLQRWLEARDVLDGALAALAGEHSPALRRGLLFRLRAEVELTLAAGGSLIGAREYAERAIEDLVRLPTEARRARELLERIERLLREREQPRGE